MFQRVDGGRRATPTRLPHLCHFPSNTNYKECLEPRGVGQMVAVMESREENALNEVDRIAVAVGYLRDLLVAATEAELRARGMQRSADEPSD